MDDEIRVLHVDDEPDFAEMAATFLAAEREGFTVETVTDPDAGLELLAEEQVDCVVSDYDMPAATGIEFLESVRERYPDLPFVLFTGKGSEEVASEAIRAGVTDYLQKGTAPDQFALLANRIENAVRQYRAERRAREQERLLSILREANQALVQSTTHEEITASVTEVLASADPYLTAWFGEYDDDHGRVVPETVAGRDDDAVAPTKLPGPATDGGTDDAPAVVEAARSNDIVRVQDADPSLAVSADDAPPVDYEAAAVVPVVYHDDRHGLLALYADRDGVFDEAERAMLDELAGDFAQALHTAETHRVLRRHRTAVESVPEGVFVLDADATIELANERAASLVGYDAGDLHGEQFPTLVEAGVFESDIVDWYLDSVRELLSSSHDREAARYEADIEAADGASRTVEIHLTLRPFEEEFRGTVGILRDVTDRNARERELEENKERYRRLVENAPIPIVLYDTDGELIYVNEAAVEFMAADDREQLLGTPALDLVVPDEREAAAERMQRVLADREPVSAANLTVLDLSGTEREALVTSVPVTYESEPAVQLVLEDVTERRARERELERQNERLEEFASIVSHDLRTPLSVARGNLELARSADDPDEYLPKVDDAHERMDTLIEDLLTLARQGQAATDLQAVDLAETVRNCWLNVGDADATLVTEADRTILADASRLKRLLENLFRNAVDHGGTGVTVTVGTTADGFYVADDGPGIPEDERDQVFEPGYSTADDGVGLGLRIVQRIAEAHDWTVEATASEDGGARFDVGGVAFAED